MIWLNGQVLPAEQARVSVLDAGFLFGASVFTTLRAHNGRAFRLDRHLRRLMGHAARISLMHRSSAEQLRSAVEQVLPANALSEARVRITLSPGAAAESPQPTAAVSASPVEPAPAVERGLGVIVSGVRQYEGDVLAGVKTGCCLPRLLARQAAAAVGADEAIWFTHAGFLAGACFANLFIVRKGMLFTPPLSTPAVDGVARSAVLELCGPLGLAASEEPLTYDDVLGAQEIFLTSSVGGIRAVVRVMRQAIGDDRPGPVTRRIAEAYAELMEKECPANQ